MDQGNAYPLENYEHCIIKEELIISDTESQDEESKSYHENNVKVFDSNKKEESNKKDSISKLRKVRKPRTERRKSTAKKSESLQLASNGHGLVVTVKADIDTAMKNLTKAYCSQCNKKTKVIPRKARCAKCSTAFVYICENCERTYKAYNSILYHLQVSHVPVKPNKCNKCSRVFNHKSNVQAHEKVCGREPKYSCAECPHQAYYKSNLHQHIIEKHSGRVFDCQMCKKVFSNQRSLNRHMRCYCGKQRGLQCHHCNHKTYRKDHMIGHLKRIHPEVYGQNIVKRTCKYCNEALKAFEHMRIHLRGCKLAPPDSHLLPDQPDIDAAEKNLSKAYCGSCKKEQKIIRGNTCCNECQMQLIYSCKRCDINWPDWSSLRQHLKYHVSREDS